MTSVIYFITGLLMMFGILAGILLLTCGVLCLMVVNINLITLIIEKLKGDRKNES